MKVYTKILLFFSITFVFSCLGEKQSNPRIIQGNLDLTEYDFRTEKPFPLYGEWIFTPGVFLLVPSQESIFVSIPDMPNWNALLKTTREEGLEIGTYQITIKFPQEKPEIAVHLIAIHSDCKLYQDSELIGEFGSIQDENSPLDRMPKLIPLKPTDKPSVKLTLFVKNRFYKWGGLRIAPIFGSEDSIEQSIRISQLKETILAGGLFFLGLYQLGIYFTRRKVKGSLYFFLFCILMFFQILVTGTQSLFLVLGKEYGEVLYRIDLFSEYTGVICGLLYIHCLTKDYIHHNLVYGYSLVLLIPILNTIFGSLQSISRYHFVVLCLVILALLLIFYLIFCYLKDKRSGSIYLGLSVILLIIAASNDIILTLLHKPGQMYLNIGLLLFVFFQSLFLSKHISGEIVSAEIKFKDVLFQLIQSEKLSSIGMTVTSVAHEINSPLSAVILTSDSIKDNVSDFFRQIPNLESIQKNSYPFILSLVEQAVLEKELPSGIEYRHKKAEFLEILKEKQISYSDQYADVFINVGIKDIPEDWIQILSRFNSISLVLLAEKIVSILQGTNAIQTAANRAIKIAQALKNFTHFDPKAEIKTIHLADSLQQILTILQGSMKHGIELKTNFVEIPPIECYPDELNQVWTNMIQNAIQSMNGKGKLIIEINQTILKNNEFAYVSIEDSGPGVPKEILDKIFDPFFTTKPIGQGTGLGLYISKQIIEKHKGIIDVISTKGNTKFIVYLPYQNKSNSITKH